jgi:hypothetical protein
MLNYSLVYPLISPFGFQEILFMNRQLITIAIVERIFYWELRNMNY